MLEIGVAGGGSLELWQRYFGPKARIVGMDINPDCKRFEKPGIQVVIGNQADPAYPGEAGRARSGRSTS